MSWQAFAGLMLLTLLAGCVSEHPPGVAPAAAVTQAVAAHDEGFWSGRFSLRVERVTNNDTQSVQQDNAQGSFSLLSKAGVTTLELTSPLGQTIAIVRSARDGASLSLGNGKLVKAANARELLEGQLGWHLPVERLPLALTALNSDEPGAEKAARIAKALGDDWSAQLVGLEGGRTRLQLRWDAQTRAVSKLALTLIIEPPTGVSTNLRR